MNKQIVLGEPFIAKRKIQCAECKEVLFSKYQGHFSRCKCENFIFIDETKHYCRIGGKSEQIIFLEDNPSSEESYLSKMNKVVTQKLKASYPDISFKLTSINPITILHDSLEMCTNDVFLDTIIKVILENFSLEEFSSTIIEYDVFEELEGL